MINLRKAMAARIDGDWELLATAANVPQSVDLTARCLSRRELDRGPNGPSGGQSTIRRRVEALAVSNPDVLVSLARDWRLPSEFPPEGDGVFIPAWRQSLRHLRNAGVIHRSQVDVPSLADEVEFVFADKFPESVSWTDAIEQIRKVPVAALRNVRRWSKCDLEEDPVQFGARGFHPLLLRALRGREFLLDPAEIPLLVKFCQSDLLLADPHESAVVVECCKVLAPDIVQGARDVMTEAIANTKDALSVVPLCYVLLETGWLTP
jgi:hypothetical protein